MTVGAQSIHWKLRATLGVSAVVLVVLGSGLLFATHRMSILYGASESVSGNNAARTAGAAILALGVLAWIGRTGDARMVRSVVLPVMFAWFLLKSVVAYLALAGGVFKPPVARIVLFFDVLLALAYGYFLFASRDTEHQ